MTDLFDMFASLTVFWLRVGWSLLWLMISLGLLYGAYVVISLPMRRQERARFFLDLLETGLKSGRSVEQTLVAISQSRDRSMGARFHLLAAHLESGLRLEEALERVPRLVPPQIAAMLRVGAHIGDLTKVLPACRQLLKDAVSQTRGALNYLLVLAFVIAPILPVLFLMLDIWIVPRLKSIAVDMVQDVPPLTQSVFELSSWFVAVQLILVASFQILVLCYAGGPRLRRWGQTWLDTLSDRVVLLLPWRRKRLQRDFSTLLAVLLDAELPEKQAVLLAAECTANAIFMQRANQVAQRLEQGIKLTEAVQQLDGSGEFRWRLTNASHVHRGFFAALAGWHEALDAKAFQQEQAAAQTLTTGLVLLNGLMVGLFAVGLFGIFIHIIQEGVLW